MTKKKKRRPGGGRPKGTKNKRTLVEEAIVSEAVRELGIKPGHEPLIRLQALGMWCESRVAKEQRFPKPDEDLTQQYLKLAISAYIGAAPYVHPRLSAVMIKQDDTPKDETIEVTLKIGDRTERITNQSDGSQVTTIEHDDTDADELAREAALSVKN